MKRSGRCRWAVVTRSGHKVVVCCGFCVRFLLCLAVLSLLLVRLRNRVLAFQPDFVTLATASPSEHSFLQSAELFGPHRFNPTKGKENPMLSKFRKNEKGFTLIELLIVVAIIGILAAIAIPQFAAYRQKAFNSAAISDIRSTKTNLEAFYTDNNNYPY
ncbi:MAG: prepilin-type N-terminal cleavage/methylation domain-containing protein [Desulfovibrio desulfuricans]|nr:prepilin-type N-terminal cleavage/methylation domain-containing protein [Desulfovibrio desulfuricans]